MTDPMYCRRCGTRLKPGSKFCTECGGSIAGEGEPGRADSAGDFRWRVEVSLLTNRFVVRDTLLGVSATVIVTALLMGGAFAWAGGWREARQALLFAGIMGAFILVVSVFTLGVIFGNRWPLEFVIGEDGVIMNNVSEKAHAIHRLSWMLAIVTGRPLMAGPGLIAQSREVIGIPWNEVRRVRRYPSLGVIAIKGGFMDNVRLYCTPANYTDVAQRVDAAVKQHAPSAVVI